MPHPQSLRALALVFGAAGCTTMLGIDGDYGYSSAEAGVTLSGGSGGRAGSGASGDGGTVSSGGGAGRGGTVGGGGSAGAFGGTSVGGAGGTPGGGPCPEAGQKRCPLADQGEICLLPNPVVGCKATGCDPCQNAPRNGYATCEGETCSFECLNGFAKAGDTCEPIPPPDGGPVGGAGGAGGSPPTTCSMDADCAGCAPGVPGCCALFVNRCGCQITLWCQPTSF